MQVGLIGAGNMARALARGWGEPVLVSDSGSGRAAALAAELGGEALPSAEVAQRADLVVLCHKPAQLGDVARELAGEARAVASILAATDSSVLHESYPGTPVFRLTPNTPVEMRRGITVYATPNGAAGSELEADVLGLFARLGAVVKLPERLMDAAGAVVGVGPAYQALLVEAQVDAAVRHGIDARTASELVVGTMAGSAALLEARSYDTLAVRREVTSPGGTTARGLEALERGGIRSAFQAAIDAVRSFS
ncbi:MAG: pyrroline-5-carboxylate reductase family protein [Solirubrobacteraceae bacterium]